MDQRVTWLLPVRNGMPYLSKTLASIEAQTYKNWEILAWDDGSTDGTLEELRKWIPDRLPGRIITAESSGVGSALASLVEESTTGFCARIDGDDINVPERLEKQVAFLESHPEVALVGSQAYCIDENGNISKDLYLNGLPLHHDDIVHWLFYHNTLVHPSVLFRRSAILDVGSYRSIPNVEDYDLWLRLASRYKIANLDLPLIYYRIHDKSTTQSKKREGELIDLIDRCVSQNAPLLFGCTESEAKRLRCRQQQLAIKTLYKIARHLQQTQGGSLLDRLRSESFVRTSQSLVSRQDIISRVALASLNRTMIHV